MQVWRRGRRCFQLTSPSASVLLDFDAGQKTVEVELLAADPAGNRGAATVSVSVLPINEPPRLFGGAAEDLSAGLPATLFRAAEEVHAPRAAYGTAAFNVTEDSSEKLTFATFFSCDPDAGDALRAGAS